MSNEIQKETLQNVVTEKELCELLGINKNQLGRLRREKRLPFIKVSLTNRLYFESDIIEFFRNLRVIIDRHAD